MGKHLDIHPKIDGDILVWSGGTLWRQAGGVWEHEPLNLGVLARNLATGKQKILRKHTMSESYSHPAVSGNSAVWLEQLNLDTTPLGSPQAGNWYNRPYNICGADITDLDNPEYFTVDTNVGKRHPYPYLSYFSDFDDVVDISGRTVVWEGHGDIYGADISNLKNVKVFPICLDSARQFDPAISDNLVVWTDTRNDKADIYGADVSDLQNIKIFPIAADVGMQHQPAIDGRTIVYVHKRSIFHVHDGLIKVCCLTRENQPLRVPLSETYRGADPAIDGGTIVWQTRSGEQIRAQGITLDLPHCLTAATHAGQ
jgi:beta propeller repeat protein